MLLMSVFVIMTMMSTVAFGFSVVPPPVHTATHNSFATTATTGTTTTTPFSLINGHKTSGTRLFMSDRERSRSTKKSVKTIEKDKVESQAEEKKNKEEMWRVVLHNDEVHTFNYVIRSLTKVIGILDRQAAFEVCKETHGIGKATVTITWKKQAEQFCLGLQRQGLTVSISPDEDFEGGHSGGGL
jgi:ATP-dependent Clp protease adapter protein ClpS